MPCPLRSMKRIFWWVMHCSVHFSFTIAQALLVAHFRHVFFKSPPPCMAVTGGRVGGFTEFGWAFGMGLLEIEIRLGWWQGVDFASGHTYAQPFQEAGPFP